MSNERIDLTQFDGLTKGKWQWFTGDGKKGLALFPSVEENDDILLWDESDPLAANQYTDNANAIAAVPDLIAELKKMYERETELLAALQVIKEYINESQSMDNIKDFVNNVCDINLPYWGCACQGPHTGPC